MIGKQEYVIGDPCWVYNVQGTTLLTEGKVISIVDLSSVGYKNYQYIIEIFTHVDTLLTLREAATMSEDSSGPVGLFRTALRAKSIEPVMFEDDEGDPSPAQIHAAMDRDNNSAKYAPLTIKKLPAEIKRKSKKYK